MQIYNNRLNCDRDPKLARICVIQTRVILKHVLAGNQESAGIISVMQNSELLPYIHGSSQVKRTASSVHKMDHLM